MPGGFDRVASTCLLSQILETAAHSLGRGHRQLAEVESALLAGHLRLMARLASPGGDATLVAEVVSSDTLANLPEMSADELAHRLTMAGIEVESCEPAGPRFSGVVVGEVLSVERHPSADKLTVCTVSTGTERLQVVCGAPNVRKGMKAPLAKVGARLPALEIKAAASAAVATVVFPNFKFLFLCFLRFESDSPLWAIPPCEPGIRIPGSACPDRAGDTRRARRRPPSRRRNR